MCIQEACERTRKVYIYAGGGETEDDLKECKDKTNELKNRLYHEDFKKVNKTLRILLS